MLELLVLVPWLIFGGYSLWFFLQAKTLEPLTLDELVILWKLHKKEARCNAPISQLEPVMLAGSHQNEFVGFRCTCGYKYLSKRPITQKARPHT